jgi:outer membrane protease
MNTKDKGDIAEAALTLALLKTGYEVLRPVGDNSRYDLVIVGFGGKFQRVQVKSGRLRKGAVRFRASSSYAHRGRGVRSYRGEVEFFGVYCRDLDKCYLVPVEDVPEHEGVLRVYPTKNGQTKLVRLAANYTLDGDGDAA